MSFSPSEDPSQIPSTLSSLDEPAIVMKGEYSRQGEFHRNLDPNWNYYPIYVNKMIVVDELLHRYECQKGKILDVGCGEGVLVEKYAKHGWDIMGVDKNYSSAYVQEGDMTELPFSTGSFDTLLALDVLEHLYYNKQNTALGEMSRVLKSGGRIIFSCPNLAHFTARLKMMFRGKLLRTATIGHHPGDRPLLEYEALFQLYGFKILERHGIFPTIPPFYRVVMNHPACSVGLLRLLRRMPFPINWHFQVILVCEKVI